MLPILLLAAAVKAATPPRPVADSTSWIKEDDYPAAARAEGREGLVQVALAVDAEGGVTGCKVVAGSGVESLDLATCRLLRERARFVPARDTRGRAIADTADFPVRWMLPVREPEPVETQMMRAHLTIAGGRITGCTSSNVEEPHTVEEPQEDCDSLGSAESLGKLFGDDAKRVKVIDVTMAMLPGDSLFAAKAPAGTRKVVLAESVFKLGSDRKIASCTTRITYALDDGKLLDMCSVVPRDDTVFAGDASAFLIRMDATARF